MKIVSNFDIFTKENWMPQYLLMRRLVLGTNNVDFFISLFHTSKKNVIFWSCSKKQATIVGKDEKTKNWGLCGIKGLQYKQPSRESIPLNKTQIYMISPSLVSLHGWERRRRARACHARTWPCWNQTANKSTRENFSTNRSRPPYLEKSNYFQLKKSIHT